MTQITPQELAQVVGPMAQQGAAVSGTLSAMEAIILGAVFVAGLVLGRFWQKLRASGSRPQH